MENILTIQNLTKSYGDNQVLTGVDMHIKKWDFFALLWHNGAGKTTIIGIISNLVNKSWGKVMISWIDIDDNFPLARTHIGVVPQEFNFDIFMKVEDICVFDAGYYGIPKKEAIKRTEHYLKKLWLWEKRSAKARELSGGMKRRLMIVRALVHEPEILILDEPTAGVDVELRKTMWEFVEELNAKGTTILLTTHYLEEVEQLCNQVAILSGGKIVEQTSVKNLLKQLDQEIFVLDTKEELKKIPEWLDNFSPKLRQDGSLEITVPKFQGINPVFDILSRDNIEIVSMRNKTNRLEQLFLQLAKV